MIRVFFNDKIRINNSDTKSWCWIGDGERVGPQYVHHTVKNDGGSVMIWGCMTVLGRKHDQYRIEGGTNRHLFKFYSTKKHVVHYKELQSRPK